MRLSINLPLHIPMGNWEEEMKDWMIDWLIDGNAKNGAGEKA